MEFMEAILNPEETSEHMYGEASPRLFEAENIKVKIRKLILRYKLI